MKKLEKAPCITSEPWRNYLCELGTTHYTNYINYIIAYRVTMFALWLFISFNIMPQYNLIAHKLSEQSAVENVVYAVLSKHTF